MEAGDGYKCSLCDVVCTGTEAFNAHLKGAKHLKVGCGVVFFVFQKVDKSFPAMMHLFLSSIALMVQKLLRALNWWCLINNPFGCKPIKIRFYTHILKRIMAVYTSRCCFIALSQSHFALMMFA